MISSDLRLALIRQRYNPYGGAERFVERALAALNENGVAVTLISRHWQGNAASGIKCDPPYLGNVWRDWSFARCVRQVLRRNAFPLVQSHERIAGCDLYRAGDGVHLEWLRHRRASLGFFARLGTYLNPYHRYVLRVEGRMYADPNLKAVICNSRMVRDEIRRSFALDPGKLHVIHNAIDITRYTPAVRAFRDEIRAAVGIPADSVAFVFVGSGFQRKGLDAVLHALPTGAHLIVVGKDRKMGRYRRMARQQACAERVHFLGGQADVRPYYGAADVFVLPSIYEPFSSTVIEAMACGLATVTSTRNGAAEAIVDGVSGYICDRPGGKTLSEILTRLLEPEVRHSCGEAARQAAQKFAMPIMLQQLQTLYASLLAAPAQAL